MLYSLLLEVEVRVSGKREPKPVELAIRRSLCINTPYPGFMLLKWMICKKTSNLSDSIWSRGPLPYFKIADVFMPKIDLWSISITPHSEFDVEGFAKEDARTEQAGGFCIIDNKINLTSNLDGKKNKKKKLLSRTPENELT
jgi:hypothetical protein